MSLFVIHTDFTFAFLSFLSLTVISLSPMQASVQGESQFVKWNNSPAFNAAPTLQNCKEDEM